jgi:hypothetical protein
MSHNQYQQWEKREQLLTQPMRKVANPHIVNNIIKAFFSNQQYSWTELTLEDEVAVLKLLQIKGVTLNLYQVNQFPRSIDELQQYVYNVTKRSRLGLIWDHVINLGYVDTFASILVAIGIIYFYSDMFWWSLVMSFFVCNLTIITFHEGWGHHFIKPKNQIVGAILDLIAHSALMLYSIKKSLAYQKTVWAAHGQHHRTWLDHNDPIIESINNGCISHVFFKSLYKINVESNIHQQVSVYLRSLPQPVRFLEQYSLHILAFFHLLFLWYFGLEYYFYFMFIQIWYVRVYLTVFSEVIPHKILKNNKQWVWLFPFIFSNAYHKTHHEVGYYLGPSWANLLNIQWWYIKIFYKEIVKRTD